ncbi:RusA family crossover junction endodeoxyribonuclease [Pannus brasiliensis CCIBt3594]|uniref:RusA family crossover junction endodeoxyribonuclease n=1 Tax=Pannus brasiliensis CCIBt3594 TaxID=1427578 RepID=A0AAW9QGR1_9CHRO
MRFEFIVEGPPVSQQSKGGKGDRLRKWKAFVRQEAEKYWSDEQETTTEPVMLQIIYFYDAERPDRILDVDNIVKPIQDAIKGLAYVDDAQVTDLLVRRRNLSNNFTIENITEPLVEGFARGKEFLHIIVSTVSDREVLTEWRS